jgi:hypothetical protein
MCSYYGLSYESSHQNGEVIVTMKPNLPSIAMFSDMKYAYVKVPNAVKMKLQNEVQLELIRGNYAVESNEADFIKKVYDKPKALQTPTKKKEEKETPKSAKKRTTVEALMVENDVSKKLTPMKRTNFFSGEKGSKSRRTVQGIVFRFQQGFTSAVRQHGTIHDFC